MARLSKRKRMVGLLGGVAVGASFVAVLLHFDYTDPLYPILVLVLIVAATIVERAYGSRRDS